MAKKGRKAQKPADREELDKRVPGDTPSFEGIGTDAIRLDHARGAPICLGYWTSWGVTEEPTWIAIQEWSEAKRAWEVIEVIRPKEKGVDQFPPLRTDTFVGRYDGEQVLSVYKESDYPDR